MSYSLIRSLLDSQAMPNHSNDKVVPSPIWKYSIMYSAPLPPFYYANLEFVVEVSHGSCPTNNEFFAHYPVSNTNFQQIGAAIFCIN